jgi:hypothetical protein
VRPDWPPADLPMERLSLLEQHELRLRQVESVLEQLGTRLAEVLALLKAGHSVNGEQ